MRICGNRISYAWKAERVISYSQGGSRLQSTSFSSRDGARLLDEDIVGRMWAD